MSQYEYETIHCADEPGVYRGSSAGEVLKRIANVYAEQGWRVVSVVMVPDDMILLIERVKAPPEWSDAHNHAPGTGCGPTCPVLIGWHNIGRKR